MKRLALLSPLLVALLAGCAALQPNAPDMLAAVPLPAQWSVPTAAAAPATIAGDWWTQLGDAQLDRLVAQALAQNNDLQTAMARVREAQAQLDGTGAARSPQLNATLGAQTGRSLGAFGPTHTRSVQPGLQASWELDVWGRLSQLEQAAGARLQASQADRDAVALNVAATTVQAYVGLRALQAQQAISEATVAAREQALQLARDQVRVGYISQLQQSQAQAELAAVQQQVEQLNWQIDKQRSTLDLLLGQAGGADVALGAPRIRLQDLPLPPVPASLPSQLLERRPDIARAAAQLAASDHQLQAQRAAFLPQVSLSASVGSLMINALNYNPLTVWSLGGSLLAPLFDAGRLQAQADAVSAQRDQAALAYRGAVLAAFADTENALTGTARLARQTQFAIERRDVLQQSLTFAHDRYQAGYASYIEELDAQRNLYAAELEVVRLHQAELDNRVQLYKALGGGWR
ncbi:efflux transporter outer membrane subunit [Acidovorax sp. CCYZU-2555]|uniref:efflux transporter outer membrane subunit n=1 Tax=Acidovorax sp. CCYZU-2555 TaxID=2835042 RepID=UPI001BCBCF05|nr:efflux transporter outer membrane subunit [Acidovorax sp. CCYZU-2555]MBS7780849.1 efflux transporter outer membrane subunit [Acidovorax sp. CCYZU-2555]